MSLTELEKWELRLTELLNTVDMRLEERYGDEFPLRPNRPPAGATGNPKYDGLVALTSSFSLGISSGNGPNYVVNLRLSTFKNISQEKFDEMLLFAYSEIKEGLARTFPGKDITVVRDGDALRIVGDLDFTS